MTDFTDPVIIEALELATALSDYCIAHDLPKELVLSGVAINAESLARRKREEGYMEGKRYEQTRIASLLGLISDGLYLGKDDGNH